MAKEDVTAASLGIGRTERRVRIVSVMPPGGWKTIRVKEKTVTLAAIPALDRALLPLHEVAEPTLPSTTKGKRRGR